jgi:pectate lyase
VGGRGGRVLEVTSLADSGPGSLRAAVTASGARTVVFRVSGTIALASRLTISHDSLTIAGQSAPGDGICIRNYDVVVDADHVIIRFIRFRPGDGGAAEADAVGGRYHHHILIDHCSASWSTDEALSFYGNDSSTVQWCFVTESLYNASHPKGAHGYGGIWGGNMSTFHHNLLAHHSSRTPRFSGSATTVPSSALDFRNNLIFNWGFNSAYGGEASTINIVGNYYQPGPATKTNVRGRIVEPYDSLGRWFIVDNVVEGNTLVTGDNWRGVQGDYAAVAAIRVNTPFPAFPVTIRSAELARGEILQLGGAVLPGRDSVDRRIVHEVSTGTATYDGRTYEQQMGFTDTSVRRGIIDSPADVGGWPLLASAPAPEDRDHDGMPDAWEEAHGLNADDPEDRNILTAQGYTQLEEYLNERGTVVNVVPSPTFPQDFYVMHAFPNPFNPVTRIRYVVPRAGRVRLTIWNLLGEAVRGMESFHETPGIYEMVWDGTDASLQRCTSGMYFGVVSFDNFSHTEKLLLIQ